MYLSLHIKKYQSPLFKSLSSRGEKKQWDTWVYQSCSYTILINSPYCKLYLITRSLPITSRGSKLLKCSPNFRLEERLQPTLSRWLDLARIDDSAAVAWVSSIITQRSFLHAPLLAPKHLAPCLVLNTTLIPTAITASLIHLAQCYNNLAPFIFPLAWVTALRFLVPTAKDR